MECYEILDADIDTGLHVIKIKTGEFDGLLLSVYNVGCDGSEMFYKFNIMNEKENTDTEKLDGVVKKIVNNLYFKECG